jgi:hypothetical protein
MKNIKKLKRKVSCSCATRLVVLFLLLSVVNFESVGQETDEPNDFRVTKGRYFGFLTFSLDQREAENEDQLLRYVIDQDRLNYRIRGSAGYAIRDNMTLGVGFGYGRQREDVTFEDEDEGQITTKRVEEGVAIVPTLRTFVPLGKGQFQIIVLTELNLTYGESLQRNFLANDVDKIQTDFFEAGLGVSPGVLLFFDRNFAFEVTVGLAGLTTRFEEQIVNNDRDNRTRIVESGIDLQINLLRLDLGIAYYF